MTNTAYLHMSIHNDNNVTRLRKCLIAGHCFRCVVLVNQPMKIVMFRSGNS